MPAERFAKGSILVADERPIFRSGLRHILESFGYRVRDASDARSAATLVTTGHFDVVVIDAQPTSAQWMAMVIAIRLESVVPILVLTSRGQKREIPAGGTIRTVQRPFSLEAFVDAVSHAIHADTASTNGRQRIAGH